MNLTKQILNKLTDLTRNWTQAACTEFNNSKFYTKVFSVLVWDCK